MNRPGMRIFEVKFATDTGFEGLIYVHFEMEDGVMTDKVWTQLIAEVRSQVSVILNNEEHLTSLSIKLKE